MNIILLKIYYIYHGIIKKYLQVIMHKLLDSWSHEDLMDHFSKIQQFYKYKRNLMLKSLEEHFSGIYLKIFYFRAD